MNPREARRTLERERAQLASLETDYTRIRSLRAEYVRDDSDQARQALSILDHGTASRGIPVSLYNAGIGEHWRGLHALEAAILATRDRVQAYEAIQPTTEQREQWSHERDTRNDQLTSRVQNLTAASAQVLELVDKAASFIAQAAPLAAQVVDGLTPLQREIASFRQWCHEHEAEDVDLPALVVKFSACEAVVAFQRAIPQVAERETAAAVST